MALTDRDKRAFRQACPDKPSSAAVLTIVDSGTAAVINDRTEAALAKMIPNKTAHASLVAAIETGSALSGRAERMLRNAVGSKLHGDNLITEINALS